MAGIGRRAHERGKKDAQVHENFNVLDEATRLEDASRQLHFGQGTWNASALNRYDRVFESLKRLWFSGAKHIGSIVNRATGKKSYFYVDRRERTRRDPLVQSKPESVQVRVIREKLALVEELSKAINQTPLQTHAWMIKALIGCRIVALKYMKLLEPGATRGDKNAGWRLAEFQSGLQFIEWELFDHSAVHVQELWEHVNKRWNTLLEKLSSNGKSVEPHIRELKSLKRLIVVLQADSQTVSDIKHYRGDKKAWNATRTQTRNISSAADNLLEQIRTKRDELAKK